MGNESQRRRSVSRREPADPEAAALFDGVRVELAVVVIVAMGALMVVVRMDWPNWLELLGMAVVGMGCGGWIAMRSRRAAQQAGCRDDSGHGS